MKHVDIYLNSQVKPNPGRGAWAALLCCAGIEKLISGDIDYATNHQAETIATVNALNALKEVCDVTIHSNSTILIKRGINATTPMSMHLRLSPEEMEISNAVNHHHVKWQWIGNKENHPKMQQVRLHAIVMSGVMS